MIPVGSVYNTIISNGGHYEWRVLNGNYTYGITNLISGQIKTAMYEKLSVGNCISAELDLTMWDVIFDTSRPVYVQYRATDGAGTNSSWYAKGAFYIDKIEKSPYSEETTITAFDAMLKAEVAYSLSGGWVATTDKAVVEDIASELGLTIESSTQTLLNTPIAMTNAPNVGPSGVTDREMLSFVASLRGGNWIINRLNQLQLILADAAPANTAAVGDAVDDFDASPVETVERVKVIVDSKTYYLAPSGMTEEAWRELGGRCLEVNLPFYGTQALADSLYTRFGGKSFYPYVTRRAFIDPKYEIGDGVTIKDVTSLIATMEIDVDMLSPAALEYEPEEAIQSLYPYVSPSERNIMYVATKAQETADDAADAASAAASAASGAATTANGAIYREQTIFKQAVSGTNTMAANTTWVTATGESVSSDTAGLTPVWTTKRPTYRSNYPVLFVATQRQTMAQKSGSTCTCTTPLKDDTTTIIDGGHITTGSIDAGYITTGTLKAIIIQDSNTPPKNSWNLSTGQFVTTQGQIAGYTISDTYLQASSGNKWTTLSPTSITFQDTSNQHASTVDCDSIAFQTQAILGHWDTVVELSAITINNDKWGYVGTSGGGKIAFKGNDVNVTGALGLSGTVSPFSFANGTIAGPVLTLGTSTVTVPSASSSQSGVVTTGAQTFDGQKTFAKNPLVGTTTDAVDRFIQVSSNSGSIVLESVGNASGDSNRGVWLGAHGTATAGRWAIRADTDNNVFLGTHAVTGTLTLNYGNQYTQLYFRPTIAPTEDHYGAIVTNVGNSTQPTTSQFYFVEPSVGSADGVTTGFFERYYLPASNANMTEDQSYNILTTKGKKQIPASGSVTLTMSGSARALVISNGGNANQRGAYILYQNGSVKTIVSASALTTSYSGSTATFTSTATGVTYLDIIIFNGSIA